MKTLSLQTCGTKHKLGVSIDKYINNGNLAILLFEKVDGHYEPFADLTTNTDLLMPEDNFAVVDTNNYPWAERLIERYGLGEFESITCSGFCRYPVYSFDMDKLKEYELTVEDTTTMKVNIQFKATIDNDALEEITKTVKHHLDWLIDLERYPEIREIFNGTITVEEV